MTMFEVVNLLSNSDYFSALLPLLALLALPSLTTALGTVGGGLATTALAAGLGAGQGAIINAATGGDVGKGALIGAGTGALSGGLGAVAGSGAQAATAGAQAAEAGSEAANAGLQTGAQAAQAAQTANAVPQALSAGADLGGGISPAGSAFDVARLGQGGAEAADIFGSGTDTFAAAPKSGLLVGPAEAPGSNLLRQGAESAISTAGATKDAGEAAQLTKVVQALGKLGVSAGGRAAQIPQQAGDQVINRQGAQFRRAPRSAIGQQSIDPVLALLAGIKRKQASRNFF